MYLLTYNMKHVENRILQTVLQATIVFLPCKKSTMIGITGVVKLYALRTLPLKLAGLLISYVFLTASAMSKIIWGRVLAYIYES